MADWNKKEDWVKLRLTEVLPLTPIDQTAPRIYTRVVYGFPFSGNDATLQDAVARVRESLLRSFSRWPFLAGQVIHPGDSDLMAAVYSHIPENFNLHRFPDEVFSHRDLRKLGAASWNFEKLTKQGAPPVAMDKDLLTLSPTHPSRALLKGKDSYYHPLTLQITSVPGGLLLGFAFHHGVFDGVAFAEFLSNFCGGGIPFDRAAHDNHIGDRKLLVKSFSPAAVVPGQANEYDVDGRLPPPAKVFAPCDARILAFSTTSVDKLQGDVAAYLNKAYENRRDGGSPAFVSKVDVVCGMLWLFVTRARFHRLRPEDATHFATAVNARGVVSEDLREGYMGNLFVRAVTPATTIGELVGFRPSGGTKLPPATVKDIAEAAWLIRKAITAAKDRNFISKRFKLAASYSQKHTDTDPDDFGRAVGRTVNQTVSGLDSSVWLDFGMDVNFGIPGTGVGKPLWARKTYSASDGSLNIMPRLGGAKGKDANWEVLLALRVEDLEKMCGDKELGCYLLSA